MRFWVRLSSIIRIPRYYSFEGSYFLGIIILLGVISIFSALGCEFDVTKLFPKLYLGFFDRVLF